MSQVIDSNIVKPKFDPIVIGDKEFDISFIPFGIAFMVYDFTPILVKAENGEKLTKEDADILLDLITEICKVSDETVTKEWLYKNIDLYKFKDIMPKIIASIFYNTVKKNEDTEQEVLEGSILEE